MDVRFESEADINKVRNIQLTTVSDDGARYRARYNYRYATTAATNQYRIKFIEICIF